MKVTSSSNDELPNIVVDSVETKASTRETMSMSSSSCDATSNSSTTSSTESPTSVSESSHGPFQQEQSVSNVKDKLMLLSHHSEARTTQFDSLPSTPTTTTTTTTRSSRQKQQLVVLVVLLLWTVVRIVLLDMPMVVIYGSFFVLCWLHHVHDNYLVVQIDAATWEGTTRDVTDMTYYHRYCNDVTDLSTTNPSDLYLTEDDDDDNDDNNSTDVAYQHQLRHGFTMFPAVLRQETATNLRNYIVSKNRNLTTDEAIWLIENKHRWSFPLGIEEPTVATAIMELTSNQRLKKSMEMILGPNPAMIELTSITSAYGANAQEFHHDGRTNLAQYARGVSHAHSIFIMLQNTTPACGLTAVCPGSHYCTDGLEDVCERHGMQPTNERGYWPAGDAMIMNMDGWHRGSAHVDPEGPDRVMLCVTFTSRPRDKAESRQIPQGISYSLRWDMWGHTWRDLETADTTMKQPWTGLRSLGLYKHPSADDWGVDYVSSVCGRIGNEYFGFTTDDLADFVRRGGFKFLPRWLQGEYNKNPSWKSFLLDTLLRCKQFMQSVSLCSSGVYLFFFWIIGIVISGSNGGVQRFGWAVLRLVGMYGVIVVMYNAAIRHVDDSQWASDLRNGLRYTSPFVGNDVSEYSGLLTFPHRNDVLIETRYKSKYLAMFNDYIGNHPGNRQWNELIDEKASFYASYSGLPTIFCNAIAEYIVSAMEQKASRVLYQSHLSHWLELSRDDSVEQATLELIIKSNLIREHVIRELDYLISEAKYGPLRNAAMTKLDVLASLLDLKDVLMVIRSKEVGRVTAVREVEGKLGVMRESSLFKLQRNKSILLGNLPRSTTKWSPRRPVVLHVGTVPGEPQPNAWLRSGDVVKVKLPDLDARPSGVYKATLSHSLSNGLCYVLLDTEEKLRSVSCRDLARYTPPSVGDHVEAKIDEDQCSPGVIVKEKGSDLYDVDVSGDIVEDISDDQILRPL